MTQLAECVMFAFYGALIVLLAVPMALGKVPPNGVYGFRVRKTLDNPDIWYAANRIAGRDLVLAGAVVVLCAGASALLALPRWVIPATFVLAPCIACAHSLWALRKL